MQPNLPPHSPANRNNRLNVLSYRMGRFVALGSITRQQVIEAFTAACEGQRADPGRPHRFGDAHDQERPRRRHERSRLRASRRDHLTNAGPESHEQEVRRSEVMALFRLRFGPHASYEAVDDVLAKIDSDDKEVSGENLDLPSSNTNGMGVEPLGRRRAKHHRRSRRSTPLTMRSRRT